MHCNLSNILHCMVSPLHYSSEYIGCTVVQVTSLLANPWPGARPPNNTTINLALGNTSENISHEQYFVTSIFLKILKGNATHIASRLMAMTCSWALSLPFLQAKFSAAVTSSRRSFSSAADTLWGIPRIWGGRRSGGRSLRNARRSHKAQELYQRELENCWRLCHNTLE